MRRSRISGVGLTVLLAAGLCHGSERVVIVLDASMGMWDSFQSGPPRIVAARSAIGAILAAPAVTERKMEIGLRTIGGEAELSEGSDCDDSRVIVQTAQVEHHTWSTALAEMTPRGLRPLVHAIREAADDLSDSHGDRRIVVVTSGADQCLGDLSAVIEELAQGEDPIPVRIVALEIEHALASALILSTPTRNVTDPSSLIDILGWAMFPSGLEPRRSEWLELRVNRGAEQVHGATLTLIGDVSGEEVTTSIENGRARIRTTPGIYRATIDTESFTPVELSQIVHHGRTEAAEIALSDAPPVTLEVTPERPLAGEEASVQYWGAPPGTNWVEICVAGAPAHQFLARSPANGAAGEVTLALPDAPNALEVQFTRDIGSGIYQLLGRIPLETVRRRVSLEASGQVENSTELTVAWNGADLPGDYITITAQEGDGADMAPCLPVPTNGPVTVTAPREPGDYVIRYAARSGRTLARADLEVYEVLATLEGPEEVAPGDPLDVSWTGPDADQDYLSIADASASDDQYRSFAPTTSGNPAKLTAPTTPGDYELRYVRAVDGEVLARLPLAVRPQEFAMIVPPVVDAGTRFEVTWTGTAGQGDFISIAHPRSGAKKHLDWSFTDAGSPVTLAAPFEPGRYVVRYVRAADQEILARAPIDVR